MITVEKRPPVLAFAGNPLRYQVVSDSLYSNVGVKAAIELLFLDVDRTIGHRFTLGFMNMILDFAISDDSNELGNHIPPASLTDTYTTWCTKVRSALAKNYFIYTYYDVLVIFGNDIWLVAKEKGSFYSLTFTNVDVTGIAQNFLRAGVDIQTYPGFGILAQVIDENNRIIGEDFRPVDADGRTRFDMSEYVNAALEDFVKPHFSIPGTTNKLICYPDGVKFYRVAFIEKYEGVTKRVWVDWDLWGLMGGLSRDGLVRWNESNPFWNLADNLTRFLTWCPSGKFTTFNQLERLFFFNQAHVLLSLNYTVYFDDDSHTDVTLASIAATPNSIMELQAGYLDLDLGSLEPTKQVTGWKVWLTSGGDIVSVSQEYEFTVDLGYKEFDRQFIFRNSFGWYDVMRATGKVESSLEHEHTEGYTIVEEAETSFNAPDKNFSVKESQVFKATTGWVTKNTQNWLRDFLLSKEVYEIIDGKVYPVKITSKKTVRNKDADYNLYLEFEYSRAYKDLYFSFSSDIGGGALPSDKITWDNIDITFDQIDITFDQIVY